MHVDFLYAFKRGTAHCALLAFQALVLANLELLVLANLEPLV